jgi:glycosyltransferase involved in cell wall biosynthesis
MVVMTAPRVAVGLFVYNGERHIRAAIDSLLGQTMGDFVLDISDNASTDLTEEICRSYMAADSRVRYVRQPENRGLTANCNYVAQLSPDTEFFKWCAHDDVYGPTYLEQCVAELDNRPELVMCHSRTRYINEHGNEIMRSFREQAFTDERPWARLEQILLKTHDYTYSFALMRRSALNRIRPFLPVYASDAVVLSELAFQGPFGELPDHLFANRMHSNRATAVVGPKGNPAVWAKWFGGSSRFPLWHTLDALRRSISAAPLDAESKARCYAVVGRWTKGQLPEFVLDVAVGGTRAARERVMAGRRGATRT